jgi:hypothetical protein
MSDRSSVNLRRNFMSVAPMFSRSSTTLDLTKLEHFWLIFKTYLFTLLLSTVSMKIK